jgi:hypothetical protein
MAIADSSVRFKFISLQIRINKRLSMSITNQPDYMWEKRSGAGKKLLLCN